MELRSRTVGAVSILEIIGRFEAYETAPVAEWLKQASEATSPPYILVNLSQVPFMDSAALASLVQGMKRCRQRGGDLYLCGLQQRVRIIFELTRLDKAFRIFPHEDEAIQAFTS